jgi:hypothetical protein
MARRAPKPGEWSYTIGALTAHERADRGLAIYTRVWTGSRYRDKRALCGPIRDERGRLVPELENAAREAAQARWRAAESGVEEVPTGPLSLSTAFRLLLHSEDGKFAAGSRWTRDVKLYSARILDIIGDPPVSEIRHAHYRKLWRALAELHRRGKAGGVPTADKIVGVLRSMIVWLQQEGHLEPGTGLPAPKWKSIMRDEFVEILRAPLPRVRKPRYTPEESALIWQALPSPEVDPRLRLAAEIGAELRLGQVPRSRRTDVHPHGIHALGAVEVHGRGKKHGELVVLTDDQRAALADAMTTGYLRQLEAAYQAGQIKDYHLIPGSRLRTVDGVLTSPVERAGVAWGKTGLVKAWRVLERVAGVPHVEGRLWYGLRRRASDDAEDVTSDARVLNKLGAWKHTSTREGYQEEGRTDIAEQAASVRATIRRKP